MIIFNDKMSQHDKGRFKSELFHLKMIRIDLLI
jgi:hypothetical protein